MSKEHMHIEIVRSNVPGLSSMSEGSASAINSVLSKHFSSVNTRIINNTQDLDALVAATPDLVFLGMEYVSAQPHLGRLDKNKIWLADVLDQYGIAYTGSARIAHEYGRNKPKAKGRIASSGLNTAKSFVAMPDQLLEDNLNIEYPLFVKPANRGGGLGIDSQSVVHNFDQLKSKVDYITIKLKSPALIEEYLPGREFSVAILKRSRGYRLMPLELIAPADINGNRLLGGKVKKQNIEEIKPVVNRQIKNQVCQLALACFLSLGARDFGRIDIRMSKTGTPYFLEANLIPSLIAGYGSFPKACELDQALSYENMILQIARLGLSRQGNILSNAAPAYGKPAVEELLLTDVGLVTQV